MLYENSYSTGSQYSTVGRGHSTVNAIVESALATATTMTCCLARRTNRPKREQGVTLSLDLLQNASILASSYPRRKRCLQSPVTVLQLLLMSNLVKKRQRVIVVAIANAIAEQQVIVVAIANPIAHSKVKIWDIFVLKIPYPRMQKARGDNLLSRILLPEFHFQKAELTQLKHCTKIRKYYKPVKIPHTLVHYVKYCTRAWSRG